MRRLAFVFSCAVGAALLLAAAPAGARKYVDGSDGSGDPFFPQAGNGGYNVSRYKLKLDYDQPANALKGKAVIAARATQNLRSFNLDLRDFYAISSLTVDGKRARLAREGDQELGVRPAKKLKRGSRFTVKVAYSGKPEPITDPDESIEGWVPTDDGAFVVNEPQGSPGWYPVNDTPRDKALYDFKVSVPAGHTVMANGELVSHKARNGKETWRWRETSPMAPYLATATNGPFDTRFYSTPSGLAMYDAVDPDTRRLVADPPNPALAFERLSPQGAIIAFFSDLYGRYPFTTGGGIIDWAPDVGYALESQTRPNYNRIPGPSTVVHEIAHQWFGNAVTLAYWPDIWLNEGFATWSEWIYDERHGGPTAQEAHDERCAIPEGSEDFQDLWFPAPAALNDASELFHTPVYDRGAMTLQALRRRIGDDAKFLGILRSWYAQNRYGNVTTADFIELAERKTGEQLDAFFRDWLYEEGRPQQC